MNERVQSTPFPSQPSLQTKWAFPYRFVHVPYNEQGLGSHGFGGWVVGGSVVIAKMKLWLKGVDKFCMANIYCELFKLELRKRLVC